MPRRNKFVAAIFVQIFLGSIGLARVMNSSQFNAYRSVDVLQLIASGMCFGAALALLFMMLRGSLAQ